MISSSSRRLTGLDLGHHHDVIAPERAANRDHVEGRSHEGDREDLEGLGAAAHPIARDHRPWAVDRSIVTTARRAGFAHDRPTGRDAGPGLLSGLFDQQRDSASPMWIMSPTLSCARTCNRSTTMCDAVDAASKPSLNSISSPTVSATGVVPKEPARILAGDVNHDRAVRHEVPQPPESAMPEGISPWAKESRKTSTPATASAFRTSSLSEDGPMVATIRVRRTWFPSLLLTSLSDGQRAPNSVTVRSRCLNDVRARPRQPRRRRRREGSCRSTWPTRRFGSPWRPAVEHHCAGVEQHETIGELPGERGGSCSVATTVMPHSWTSLFISSSMSIWWRRSRPVIGSSNTTTIVDWVRARARTVR